MQKIQYLFIFLLSLTLAVSCEPGRDTNGDLLFGLDSVEIRTSSDTLKNIQKQVVDSDTVKVGGSNGNRKFTLKNTK